MRTHDVSRRAASELDPVEQLVLEFEEAWRTGRPPLERFRDRLGANVSTFGLSELIKADLHNRYRRGERPTAREYLERFPILAGEDGRALSLIYEEYCLRVEAKENVDTSEFCDQYPSWRDSLVSQLAFHRELGQAAEPPVTPVLFPDVGDHFAGHELVESLGVGGAVRVFRARDLSLGGKECVLKITLNRGTEPAILGKLDHPNIVPVQSLVVDSETGLRGLAMPYRSGIPLDRLLKNFRRHGLPQSARELRVAITTVEPDGSDDRSGWSGFPERGTYADAVAWLGLKLASALAHAHAKSFFHRDVKPENILLTDRDGPQLLDFNLAHDPSVAENLRSAHRGGTLPYMAREHLEAFLDPKRWDRVGAPADIFSLGLILRELLTGQATWKPPENLSLPRAINALAQHRETVAEPSLRSINRRIPFALSAIVSHCLAASPEDRFPTADSLVEDLSRFLDRRGLLVARNPSSVEVVLNRVRRKRRLLMAGCVLALSLSPVGYLATTPRRSSGEPVAPVNQAATAEALDLIDLVASSESKHDGELSSATIKKVLARPDAIDALSQGARRYPRSIAIAMGQAFAMTRGHQVDPAIAAYRHVLSIDPLHIPAYQGLVDVEFQRNRHESALGIVNEALRAFENTPGSLKSWPLQQLLDIQARILIKAGDQANGAERHDEALACFDRVLESLSNREAAWKAADPDQKARFLRLILFASAHSGRMKARIGLNQMDQARSDYELVRGYLDQTRRYGAQAESLTESLERDLREQSKGIKAKTH